ncbi:MmgE/PrpD family protein [Novosphingobium resinovorum]|uniref:MmgE/PrpD family protein n=1 Tax=Novosphingobium resinovorum TaxID=158500 RepID=A0A031JQZ5_9SPHN|nr:MmgE/PrpD family protein [Novosphingobium resinovorum]EZP79335.1 MmgE/PrpD family protein [Novosphingobium resinovorum]
MAPTSSSLASFAVRQAVDEATCAASARAILDTLAVIAAGHREDPVTRVASALRYANGGDAMPSLGGEGAYRQEDAALVYGTASHALDYDDVCMLAICHPSAPVVAALLAAAPWDDLTGPALCEAHAIGTEVMIRIGQAVGFRHYELGFHSTATMGVFGATAAVARLRGLDTETTATALAIAASLSSGLRLNFGTMVKPLHVGIAAANALRAVAWASADVEASHGDLFAAGGVLEAFSGGTQRTWPESLSLGAPFAIARPGFEQKRYPCCYMLHKIIALGIEASTAGLRLGDVARLRIEMPRGGTRPLIYPRPVSGREAMFSAPYTLLVALNEGNVGFASFTDDAVARQHIRSRFEDVTVEEVGDDLRTAAQVGEAPVCLELQLKDGSVRRFERHAAPGSPGDPLSSTELRAKWVDCLARARAVAETGGTDQAAAALYDEGLDRLRAGNLAPWLNAVWNQFGCASDTLHNGVLG